MYMGGAIMPHRPLVLLFLGLFLFLNPIVASSALIGRGELGGDSLWGLDLNDAFSAGAAEIGTLLDFVTAPRTTDTPSGAPSEQLDESPSPSPEGPDQEGSSPFESTAMKKCAAEEENQVGQLGGSDVEQSWWQVEQEPETGRPVISACDLPKDNDQDVYIVREIRFVEGRMKSRWPAAILVSDPANEVNFRYNVIRVGKSTSYTYQKIPNAIFVRLGQVVQLGYVRRRGWLVGAGQSKDVALKWFEDAILGTTRGLEGSITKVAGIHYSAAWIAKVIAKADESGSPYWISETPSP